MKTANLIQRIQARLGDRRGTAAMEYGLLAASISVLCITSYQYLGTYLKGYFQTVANAL